jgi:hypothetical protein
MADRRGPPSEFQDRAAEIADHTGVFFDNWHDRSSNVSRNARARLPRGDRSKPIGEILTTNRSQSPVEGVSTERSQFDTVFTVLRPTKQSHRSGRCDFVRLRVKNGPLRGVRASAPDRANPISGGSCDQTKPIRGEVEEVSSFDSSERGPHSESSPVRGNRPPETGVASNSGSFRLRSSAPLAF